MSDVTETEESEGQTAIEEQLRADAVKQGLDLKQQRDKEDALIAIAEEWLAEQEPEPEPEPEPEADEEA